MAEASLTAKGTASGLVRDIKCASQLVLMRCLMCKEDMLNCAAAGGCGPVGTTCTWAANACWPVSLPAAVVQCVGRFPPSRYSCRFLDMDTAFWQVARQHWLQYGAYDDRTVPYLGAQAVWVWACVSALSLVLVLLPLLLPPSQCGCRAVRAAARPYPSWCAGC